MKKLVCCALLLWVSGAFAAEVATKSADAASKQSKADETGKKAEKSGRQAGAEQLPDLPPPDEKKKDGVDAIIENVAPLSPEEIRRLRRKLDDAKRAAAERPGIPPKPATPAYDVNLSPGALPVVIRLAYPYGSIVSFVDENSNSWPVDRVRNFAPDDFTVDIPVEGSSTISISALGSFGNGNAAVYLKGMPNTPISLTLISGQKEADYRVDLRIPRINPAALPTSVTAVGQPEEMPGLQEVLAGVPPQTATQLKLKGGDAKAWKMGGMYVVRTRYTALSAFRQAEVSSDGTNVYSFNPTPEITVMDNGSLRTLTIEE